MKITGKLVSSLWLQLIWCCSLTIILPITASPSMNQETVSSSGNKKVKVIKVAPNATNRVISGMGSVSCPKSVELGFDENGVISEISIEEGDPVRAGETLAKLDSSVLEAEKRAAKSRLDIASAEVQYFQNELEKKESLYRKQAISDTDYQKAVLELAKSKATLDYSQAEIKTVEAKLKRRILIAPMSGLISQKHVEVGAVISPSSNKVVSMISCSEAIAEIELGEKLFSQVHPGMTVRVKADALEGLTFEGEILRTAPQIDKKHRTFIAKAVIDNSKWRLRPGMFIRAEIDSTDDKKPFRIPQSALQMQDSTDSNYVFIVKDGMAIKRSVSIGKSSEGQIEILKGLSKGDLVIVETPEGISDLDEVIAETSGKKADAE